MASSAGKDGADSPESESGGELSIQGSVTSVKVAVRVRPLIGMETAAGCQACMFGDSDANQVGGLAGCVGRCVGVTAVCKGVLAAYNVVF